MTATVSANYVQGKIELLETPVGIRDGKVRVIVIEEGHAPASPNPLQYGKYRSGALSAGDDFSVAEWHGDKNWDSADGE
jgi:hypothetical protein